MLLFNCVVILSMLISFSNTLFGFSVLIIIAAYICFIKKIRFAELFKKSFFQIIPTGIFLAAGYFTVLDGNWYMPAIKFFSLTICARILNLSLNSIELLSVLNAYLNLTPFCGERKKKITAVMFSSYNIVIDIIDGRILTDKDKKNLESGFFEKIVFLIDNIERRIDIKLNEIDFSQIEKKKNSVSVLSFIPSILIISAWWICEYSMLFKL